MSPAFKVYRRVIQAEMNIENHQSQTLTKVEAEALTDMWLFAISEIVWGV